VLVQRFEEGQVEEQRERQMHLPTQSADEGSNVTCNGRNVGNFPALQVKLPRTQTKRQPAARGKSGLGKCVIESVRESRDSRIGKMGLFNVFRMANSDINLTPKHPSCTTTTASPTSRRAREVP